VRRHGPLPEALMPVNPLPQNIQRSEEAIVTSRQSMRLQIVTIG